LAPIAPDAIVYVMIKRPRRRLLDDIGVRSGSVSRRWRARTSSSARTAPHRTAPLDSVASFIA
jgi:hypothetical protein